MVNLAGVGADEGVAGAAASARPMSTDSDRRCTRRAHWHSAAHNVTWTRWHDFWLDTLLYICMRRTCDVMIALLVVLALQLCVGSALVPSASSVVYFNYMDSKYYIFYIKP